MTQINDSYMGFYTNYQYNKQRLDKVQTNGSSTLTSDASANVQYSYYANNLVNTIAYPTLTDGSKIVTTYTYNKALGWIESITNTKRSSVLSGYSYSYDNNGNRITVSESRNDGAAQTTSYTYDALNRLVSITRPDGGKTTYTYDVRGNRQTLSDTSNVSLESVDTSYTYDLQNTLTSVTKGGSTTSFKYYADGLRFMKTNGNTQTQVNYNLKGEVISQEKIVSGVFVEQANFVRGDRVLVKKDKKASKDYYYLYNGHGDVVQIVDTSGAVINNYTYDEWGNITSQVEGTSNSFKYTGEVYDAESGLYYLRARYYDPSMGRFLNEDTVEGQINNPLTQNLYTYVGNNPLKYTDPSGKCFWDACILEGAAAAALVEGAIFVIGASSILIWNHSNAAPVEVPRTDAPKLTVIQGGKNNKSNSNQTRPLAPPVAQPKGKDDSTNKERIILYHYTDEAGYNGILDTRKINPSIEGGRRGDARYGSGVYLTDIAPNSMSYEDLSAKLYGKNNKRISYTYYYIAIDVTDLALKYGRENVYAHLTTTPLDISNRLVNAGYNSGTNAPNLRP
ncbi:tRNA3(Ser)-specific nuclease WapA precursor [compost metagenome]